MNRWSDAFEKHQFHTLWKGVLKAVDEIKLGAETNENIVTEFMRFEKVVKLIESILENVDRDVFHLQTLANAQGPVQQAVGHVSNFQNNQNDLSQIQAANNQIDQVLNFFRPYMVMPDAVAKGVKEVSTSQKKLLDQLKASLVEISQERLDELKETLVEAKKYLQEIKDDSEKSNALYQRLFGEDGISGLSAEIDSLHKKIQSTQSQSTQVSQAIQSIEQTASQANTRIEGYEASSKQSADEIESLLPGAVSAGLASEYKKLKDECTGPINKFTNQFYIALSVLLVAGIVSFVFSVQKESVLDSLIYNLLQGSPIILPAIWFAIFTSRRRNELERLRQEYAHKQAVTSSYQSFKEQIDRLGENQPEMLSALMNTAIKTIGNNASKVLGNNSKESTPVHESISAVGQVASKVTQGFGKDANK